ncbi:hypothetical protein [Bacillus subtilis]|uniref:hypothetical protein n=1 Tax=Bacillus subtilis TaxID=1423 RepID=UPI0011996FA1|nr:hypothetical protein [Bacillus subtilis]TWG71181.1 hypothetical protein L607_000100006680 [Bacillus subtilis J24]TWG75496.1 hypothetical protein L605_000200006660 [Bacillus subtilis J26]
MISFFLKRLLKNKEIYLSLFISIVLMIVSYLGILFFHQKINLPYEIHNSPFLSNIAEGNTTSAQTVWILILPLLASLPMSGMYREDKNTGFFMNVITKTTKKKYFTVLFGLNVVISFLVIFLPLLLNLYLLMMTYPSVNPDGIVNYMDPIVLGGTDLANLYYENSLIYTLILFILNGLYGAILSSIGLALSFFIKKKYFVYIIPFLINLIGFTLLNNHYNPMKYIVNDGGFLSVDKFIYLNLSVFIVTTLLYMWGKKRRVLL